MEEFMILGDIALISVDYCKDLGVTFYYNLNFYQHSVWAIDKQLRLIINTMLFKQLYH